MSFIKSILGNFLTDKSKKSISLFTSMILSLIVGIVISIINTRYLGKEQYGDFKFILNLFSLGVTFLTFGFFYTGGLKLARTTDNSEKRILIGNILLFAVLSSLLLILVSFIFSFFEHRIFNNNLGSFFRLALPLVFAFPFQLCLEQLLQGTNRIYSLSVFRIAPKITYIVFVLILQYFSRFNLESAIIAHLLALAVIIAFVIILLKPKLRYRKACLKNIIKENRSYGFPMYLGAITGVASSSLAGITIGYYIDNVHFGFYSLAITATLPLIMLPSSFGITFFKAFVAYSRIPGRIIILTGTIGVVALTGFLLFIDKIVVALYSEEFIPVIGLSYYLAIGALFHGYGDFLNRFIIAKGLGKLNRNSNFILGGFNALGFFILPKYFGVEGAAYTRLFSGILYFSILLIIYIRYQRGKYS